MLARSFYTCTCLALMLALAAVSATADTSPILSEGNPFGFVRLYERTPGGIDEVSVEKSLSYITSETDLIIAFDSVIMPKTAEIKVSAEITYKKGDTPAKPLNVPGYATVNYGFDAVVTNDGGSVSTYTTVYNARKRDNLLNSVTNADIRLTNERLNPGDRVVVQITNKTSNTVYTRTFEVQDIGWDTQLTAGAVWVKLYGSSLINFETAPSAGFEIYYKRSPSASIWTKLLLPSFGPHVIVTDEQEQKIIGLGAYLSFLKSSVQIGTGAFLNKQGSFKDRSYYFIGISFLDAMEAL